ncbi:MAG TPA: SMP-30/gluconolactonase/LRE family protein [Acidimicrobiales bacterium]|jgi:sugar lactone lactonase YvrE|nr:SMP-30/gluconolactonase/LRE family protein [Acidimicrobiales bacterium]
MFAPRPGRFWRRWSALAVAPLAVALLLAPASSTAASARRSFGDARVVAHVPDPPGFPEGIALHGTRVYVAGPAAFGTTGKPPSRVVAFDSRSGALAREYRVEGERLDREHANSSIAFDGAGRLYVLSTQLGVYRLDPATGTQEPHAEPFPDLPPCATGTRPCSPAPHDAPPIPNDLAFDEAGNAYVTDSTQATVWRIEPVPGPDGKRHPTVWFQDHRLASEYIGANGIRFDPQREHLYITVSTDLSGRSFVYTLPFPGPGAPAPPAGELQPFHEYLPGELPDGIAFGQSGLLYVAIANPAFSGVSILAPRAPRAGDAPLGEERVRLRNPPGSPAFPYDSPANIAFTPHGSILLTTHAFVTGAAVPSQFTVLDVFVDDKGVPLERPSIP